MTKGVADRKFLSEFAVNLYSARWFVVTPNQIAADLEMPDDEAAEVSRHCHIYLICRRPASFFDPGDFQFDGQHVGGHLIYKIAGAPKRIEFQIPFQLADDAVRVELSPYPHREFHAINASGEVVRYVPAHAISLAGIVREQELQRLEVLYVGQAYAEGNRTAIDRLKSHSTLQRILADTHYEMPDDEILLLAFEYAPYRVISSFDGIDKKAIDDERDTKRFISILENPLSTAQQICLTEAGLIRYFRPRYNVVYKESFPASDQALLNECYEFDFSALIVEIGTEELQLPLYSASVAASEHHIAQFDLVDSKKRRSFFTFVDREGAASEMPGVIPPTR